MYPIWAEKAFNNKLSHLQIDHSYKILYAMHCAAGGTITVSRNYEYDA